MTTQRGQGEPAQPPGASTPREGIVLPANGEPWIPEGLQPGQVQPVSGQPWGPDTDGGHAPQPVPPAGGVLPAGVPPVAGDAAETRLIPPFGDAGHGMPQGPPPGVPHSQYVPPPLAPLPPRPTAPPPGAPPMPGSGADETQVLPPQAGFPQRPHQLPNQPVPPVGGVLPAGVPPVAGDTAETRLIPPFGDAGHGAPQGAPPGVRQGQPAPPAVGLPASFAGPGDNEPTQLIGTPVPPGGGPYRPGPGQVPAAPPARGEAESTAPLRVPLPPEAGRAGGRETGPAAHGGVPLPPEAGQAPPPAPAGIPSGMSGDRRPPAEFDNLFRAEPMAGHVSAEAAAAPPEATRPMPAFGRAAAPASQQRGYRAPDQVTYQGAQQPSQQTRPPYGAQPPGTAQAQAQAQGSHTAQDRTAPQAPPSYEGQPPHRASNRQSHQGGGPQGRAARREASRSGPSRSMIIGIVVAGCAVTGLAAGAMLSGGDDNDDSKTGTAPAVSPSASAPQSSPAADIAKAQATELSALLADSNNSRTAVIRSVQDIRACDKLDKAAADLRAAARQRNDMVTRLNGLTVDELPNHQALIKALTTAWKASARADDNYAAWAEQVAGKHGCPGGKARATGQLARGNAASGEATKAKQRAANLWNPTARSYGLPQRDVTQL